MDAQHYFSSAPDGPIRRRTVEVELDGRAVTATTAGGIFSPDGIDKGTGVLLRHVPRPTPTGELLDVGCGWGPIALTMALQAPEARVWAVDVNERSRTLCRENAEALGLDNVVVAAPEEVPAPLEFTAIWSNPPIRIGKPQLHALLRGWLPRLASGGEAWLVVQKNLGADSLQKWLGPMLHEHDPGFSVDRPETQKGFRLLRARRD